PPTPAIPSHSYVLGTAERPADIARRYGVSLSAMRDANPGVDLSTLKPGDTIAVPNVPPPKLRVK
ncbi:MAG TPA: LysM domain-containing protein, partial [Verrucomicrobiae bacterium]|nr:LysM domain-containing protein [Verrucomicrobiae bacterium]